MKRGTTPTLTLTVDTDLDGWTVYVTVKSGCTSITVDDAPITVEDGVSTILVTLSQEETLALRDSAEIQLRAIKDGTAIATDIAKVDVGRILQDGVIGESR